MNMVLKPLQRLGSYPRAVVQGWFDPRSLDQILSRTAGNPLHVQILCEKIFDHYTKNPILKNLKLNREVMDEVMVYYSTISSKSDNIKNSLTCCSREQLDAFSLLYRYEGFNLQEAVTLMLCFSPLDYETISKKQKELLNAFFELRNMDLFENVKNEIPLYELKDLGDNVSSSTRYRFFGNTIDRLFASYYYEDLTNQRLKHESDLDFENALCASLAEQFNDILTGFGYNVEHKIKLVKIFSETKSDFQKNTLLIQDINKLINIQHEDIGEKDIDILNNISSKYELLIPALVASLFELKGYFAFFSLVKVRGKSRFISKFVPVFEDINNDLKFTGRKMAIDINDCLERDYFIKIEYLYLWWIPVRPLLVILSSDLSLEYDKLVQFVLKKDFHQALESSRDIFAKTSKISTGYIKHRVDASNNYAFCLMNSEQIIQAEELLNRCKDKSLISRLNLSFLYFYHARFDDSKKILSSIIKKKQGVNDVALALNLFIRHNSINVKDTVAYDISIYNVACWNMALLSAYNKKGNSSIYSFLKKVRTSDLEKKVDERVRSWIYFYIGQVDKAIESSLNLIKSLEEKTYFFNICEKDHGIFTNIKESAVLIS